MNVLFLHARSLIHKVQCTWDDLTGNAKVRHKHSHNHTARLFLKHICKDENVTTATPSSRNDGSKSGCHVRNFSLIKRIFYMLSFLYFFFRSLKDVSAHRPSLSKYTQNLCCIKSKACLIMLCGFIPSIIPYITFIYYSLCIALTFA